MVTRTGSETGGGGDVQASTSNGSRMLVAAMCVPADAIRSVSAHKGWATRRARAAQNEDSVAPIPPGSGVGHLDSCPKVVVLSRLDREAAAERSWWLLGQFLDDWVERTRGQRQPPVIWRGRKRYVAGRGWV